MKCPKCSRRRSRGPDADGKYKCRKCRHTWKAIITKAKPEE